MTALDVSLASARRLTERIRLMALTVGENIDKLKALVTEAKESEAHLALGYASWTAYLADVLGETPMRLERDVRQSLVAELHEQGMSSRAIAPIVGAHFTTVADDIARVGIPTPAPEPPADPTAYRSPDESFVGAHPITGEVIESEPAPTPVATTIGLDGKQYPKPEPKEPRRSSLIEEARSAGWQLRKAIERIERIAADDRFQKNKVEVTAALRPHLDFATEIISSL